jgi:hypothetical protein
MSEAVQEIQGWFPDASSLQEALNQLTRAGYDKADFSMPEEQVIPTETSQVEGGGKEATPVENQQLRTMLGGTAGASAGMAAAGIAVATGGVGAAVVGAAAGAGLAATALTSGSGVAAEQALIDERNRRGAEGTLVLAVRIAEDARATQVEQVMKQAGATRTERVARSDEALTAGVSASSWTG